MTFSLKTEILTTCNSFRNAYTLIYVLSANSNTFTRGARILNGDSRSPTSVTCHLNNHGTLAVVDCTSTTTVCTPSRCCSWLTLWSITGATNTLFLKLHRLVGSVNAIHKTNFHAEVDILSPHLFFCLLTHVEEGRKIPEYGFIEASLTFSWASTSEEIMESCERVPTWCTCLGLFVSS